MQVIKNTRVLYWLIISVLIYTGSAYAQSPRTVPGNYSGSAPVNYVRVWDAKAPEQNANTLMGKGLREAQQTTQYFDGLGRPLQTVVKQGSFATNPSNPTSGAAAVDLISMTEYDAFGREVFQYLPTPSTATDATKNNGSFKLNPFAQQAAFYSSADANKNPIAGQGETWFYGETRYEASPLNRVNEIAAPGNNWSGTMHNSTEANRRSVKTKYYVNTATDAVRIWNVVIGTQGAFSTYNTSGMYPAGMLYKTITIDEENKQVVEFKDKEGKVILKKVQLSATDNGSGSNHTGWLNTYYLYDDFGNLRLVVQPRGVELFPANWQTTNNWQLNNAAILAEQSFRYEYDERQRLIIKKVPGAGEVNMVYDNRDRLVMTQDAKLKAANQYLVTKYDELNRSIETGLWNNTTAAQTHRVNAKNITGPHPVYPNTTGTYTYLTRTGYNNYGSIPSGSGLNATLETAQVNATYGFYTTYNAAPDYAQQLTASTQTRGLVTWTETRIVGTGTFTYTVNIYDSKARLIQVKSKNHLGGADVLTTQYSWAGQPLVTLQKQEKPTPNAQTIFTVTKYLYDDLGRMVRTDKKIRHNQVNSDALPSAYTTISKQEYDALGQLKKKNLGQKPGAAAGTPLSVADHRYNIRGWLLGVNKDYIAETSNNDRYFGFELGYDKNPVLGTFTPRHNGNIAGMLWKSEGDQEKRKYNYSYDAVNRLSTAIFTQHASGTGTGAVFNNANGMDFSLTYLTYDANGNILRKIQKGLMLNTARTIDDLSYGYIDNNSNKLARVNELAPAYSGKLGDFKDGDNTDRDYTYDVNGNLTQDLNKNISTITYNHLNLPQVITVTGKGTITYSYNAAGNKLKKVTVENGVTVNHNGTSYTNVDITTTSSYVDGIVYESKAYSNSTLNTALGYTDKLQLTAHEEGRIRPLFNNAATPNVPTGFAYDYFLKDHLGNTRMVLTEEQKQDIYPAATLEGSLTTGGSPNAAFVEKDYYTIDPSKIAPKGDATGITDYPNHNGNPPVNPNPNSNVTANSAKLYKLNGSTNKTGLGITLKVMAGDRIDILGKSYYFQNNTGGTGANLAIPTLEIVTGLLGGPTGGIAAASHGGVTASQLNGNSNTTTGINALLTNQTSNAAGAPTVPKAYINYIFFDEQFKVVASGFSKVGSNSVVKTHTDLTNKTAAKNGYVYIYVSNESPVNVFFDNLQVIHTRGQILEETHYYPFGLTMAGISSKALNGIAENKFKYNGIEQNNDFDLNMYDAFYRNFDPQVGRWWQIDPKPNDSESPYAAMGNNPISHSDFLGDTLTPQLKLLSVKPQDNKDGDQKGVIRNATQQEYGHNTMAALGKDILHLVAEFLGFNAIDDAIATVLDPNTSGEEKAVVILGAGLSASRGGKGGKFETIPDNAMVVRGGSNTPEMISKGTGTHPEGPTGVSVECGNCSVQDLSKPLPHGQIGVTTVEKVRNAGGDVIRTSGGSPNHATMTGLSPQKASELLNPTIPNPNKKQK
ncbi:MAG: hypothetical protein KIT80_05815 [Chitinophagaceae bacterium]|nr:hypothetical protein [Chitinophagaceae bacterium]MCW5926409.1 hypothetical protein [Chitinophagaceae bacterium]